MQPQSVLDRLARLEERVLQLEGPAIPQLRAETRAGFAEFRERFDEVDHRFEAIDHRFEAIDRRFEAVDRRFEAVDQRFEALDRRLESLERRMEQGFEEARRHSLVLYEDLVTRISTIGEALAPAARRPRRKR